MSDSASASRQVSPALERAYQFLAWLIPTLDKFPRRQKFLLGDRIEATALDVLEGLVEATYTRHRGRLLETANLKLDKLRLLLRLAHELGFLDHRRYEHAARGIDEIGRLVGGWIAPVGSGSVDSTKAKQATFARIPRPALSRETATDPGSEALRPMRGRRALAISG
jgi:hypothetical protein